MFVANDLTIGGSTSLFGDMSLNSGISIEGDSSFNGRLFVADKINVNGISIGRALNDLESTTTFGNQANANLVDVGGVHNTAVGYKSLSSNVQEPFNTSVGSQALQNFNGGSTGQNTAVGADALLQTTTGGQNVALGYEAGKENKSGIQNIFIGATSGMDDANGALNKTMALGYGAKTKKDGQTLIKNDEVFFEVANDISGTVGKLHIGMINFTPGGKTGMIPQLSLIHI